MINIEPVGKDFVIFGRDKFKNRYRREVKNFTPYFYVPNEHGSHVSLYGDKLRKVHVSHPAEVKKQRENHARTYEADVTYVNRYLIDTYDEIPQEPVRVCYMDIEVKDNGAFPDIIRADKEILSIACYDNFNEKYYVFTMIPYGEYDDRIRFEFKGNDVLQFTFKEESEMLIKFVQFIDDFDFDVFLAWNGDGFDYPYLYRRMMVVGIDPSSLSPINQFDEHSAKPRGRTWLDLMRAYRKLSTHELESYGLDFVAKDELGIGKMDKDLDDGTVYSLWHRNFKTFTLYNLQDVYLMKEIDKKRGIIPYFDSVRRLTFSTWYDVFFNARVLDFYFLKKAKTYGFVLPTKRKADDNYIPVEGARVIQPTVGIKEWIGVGDVRSLYPTAILTCNMSPETRIGITEADAHSDVPFVKVGPTYFRTDVRGFIPRVVGDLWDFRQSLKSEMKKYSVGSPEYVSYDEMQTVAKFLLNSVYGVMLAPFFRLFSREVGAAVTLFGREANMWMEKQVKDYGSDVIAGDTDSIFFKLNVEIADEAILQGQELIDFVNGSLDDFCIKKFGSAQYNKMFVEFDKVYRRVLFVGDDSGVALKKRYAGLVIWKEGKIVDELDVKGFETRRSDTPSLYRKMQKDLLRAIVSSPELEVAKPQIIGLLKDMKQDIIKGRIPVEEIAIPKGMSKPLHEYTKNISAHVQGAIYYNKHFGGNIKKEKVRYVYVKSPPPGLPQTHVISFVDKCPDGFEIDYEKMANLLINDKVDTIFTSLGWNIAAIEDKTNTLEKWL